jgi:4-hydroxybenzoate polyprenyltransferase
MSLDKINGLVQLTRPENASGSALTYLIGYFFAASGIKAELFIGLFILLLLHSFATVQNDIEDFEIDRANKRTGILQDNSITLNQARLFCKLLVAAAVVLAVFSDQKRLNFIVIVGLSIVAGFYNLNPVRASKRPVTSIAFMGLCYGALPLIYGYLVGGGKFSAKFILLGCLFFIARASTSILKDYKDAKGDKAYNKKTFYLRYGAKTTARVSILGASVAYIGLVAMMLVSETSSWLFYLALVLAVLLAILSIVLRVRLAKNNNEKSLNKLFTRIFYRHNQFEGALVLCLILSSK